MTGEKLTPMIRQWKKVKQGHEDYIIFFRMGDFYEMFFDDAKEASRILDITLTSRAGYPMCGVPYHAMETYLDQLLAAGRKVAICEQVEDPKKAKGIVKRDITHIVTPGTMIGQAMVGGKANNYIASLARHDGRFGLSLMDITTAEFKLIEFTSETELINELMRTNPAECLLPESVADKGTVRSRLNGYVNTLFTPREDWVFDYESCYSLLTDHFRTHSLDGFGCVGLGAAVCAAGALLGYISDTLCRSVDHIKQIQRYSTEDFVVVDPISLRNLEVVESIRGRGREGTLLDVIDRTVTPMGSRLIATWIRQPLLDSTAIIRRQDAVDELFSQQALLAELRELLRNVRDMERLISRIDAGHAGPREVVALKKSLLLTPKIGNIITELKSDILVENKDLLVRLDSVIDEIDGAVVEEPPATLRDGGVFKKGYNAELDELREISTSGKGWIATFQEKERRRTGIKSLKVGYNKVFGYYLEISHANRESVPEEYIRKQTLVNSERYITPEMKEHEARVLGAEEKIVEIEQQLFVELRSAIARETEKVQAIARAVAVVDVLSALAAAALENDYCRPMIDDGGVIEIVDGRHPVIESLMTGEKFVPNSVHLDHDQNQLIIITGPNMAGKSTYIRQVALLVLLAQIGSFIPAKSATIGTVDKIFTRVGASDELARGQSTFMVEMNECANILNNATAKSLIILDEIGRGTSTYDGISIAWAVAEYLVDHEQKRARTLFATHYHELTQLSELHTQISNYNVAVREWNDEVIFLRKIIPGGTDKSYGIHVADMAGLPVEVVDRAKTILNTLEKHAIKGEQITGDNVPRQIKRPNQMMLFDDTPHPAVEELKEVNLNELTPIEALNKLKQLKDML